MEAEPCGNSFKNHEMRDVTRGAFVWVSKGKPLLFLCSEGCNGW